MADITIVDYGVGNLLSVCRAFEYFGAQVELTSAPEKVVNAKRLVLPGVGAFADAMAELERRQLIEPIKNFCQNGRPFLGICLGMQMMLNSSEEFGLHKGLGLIDGKVIAIPTTGQDGRPHKIPHIGWKSLIKKDSEKWQGTILENIPEQSAVYFVHSFMASPSIAKHCLAVCKYNGIEIPAVIHRDNLYGCQFHPEKSGSYGLSILSRFLHLKS